MLRSLPSEYPRTRVSGRGDGSDRARCQTRKCYAHNLTPLARGGAKCKAETSILVE